MTEKELNQELDRWNRFNNPNGLIPKAETGTPLTCAPLVYALKNYRNRVYVETFKNIPENVDAPPTLNPKLKPWGEMNNTIFAAVRHQRTNVHNRMPTAAAADFLEEIRKQNDLLDEKYFTLSNQDIDFLTVDTVQKEWQTVTRTIPMPDFSGLDDEAAHVARSEYLLENLPGKTQKTEYGHSGMDPIILSGGCREYTAETYINGNYSETENAYTIEITAWDHYPMAAFNHTRQTVKILFIWQDLPFEIYTEYDTSGNGNAPEPTNPDPKIKPYWTAPLAAPLSCSTDWRIPTAFAGLSPFSGSAWPVLVWNQPTEDDWHGPAEPFLYFSDVIHDLKIQWKEVEVGPGETVELLPAVFKLPEYLRLEDLTTFNNAKVRRLWWAGWKPE